MNKSDSVNYGPLTGLIGTWSGKKGLGVALDPDGLQTSLYYESITFSAAGEVSNAEEQSISAVHYMQQVQRRSDNKIIHCETGYWMWDANNNSVMRSLAIPRGVCVLAGGSVAVNQEKAFVFDVHASIEKGDWQLIQSPFMLKNAKMRDFKQQLTLQGDKLSDKQTMILDNHGKIFEHSDVSVLLRQ
ncbi:heme-binding beta-barrel domain-containing protein [Psychromonas sp. CD1]|uniref:heme-binding beta-barrel domain-containing protein n=1 Tax=Psychromonas sp. CD1 TaxID=1979839 RepID=UPI000B9C25E1|nr:heme-binding beta-barrel domain-containing protein [Psychromonas sp. CD1]